MEEMLGSEIKCKNCGARYALSQAVNGVIVCEYCDSILTVPKKDISPAALSFLRMGEHDLDICKFDDAYAAFSKAADINPGEPEAWWGKALSERRIQNIKDVVNKRMQPICHEVSDKKFSENKNYQRALELATAPQRAEYERKAAEIDDIREKFFRMEQQGLDFDCFLCVKVSAEDGSGITEDSKDADSIYNFLQDNGYKPFYSERTIRNKTGADYEAMILYGLYKSETMIVICRNEDYLRTPWVQNEYTRFLKLVNDEEKESDSVTIAYFKKPISVLPGKNGKIQGIDLSLRDAYSRILKFVDAHTPVARERRRREKEEREREANEIRRQIEEQKRYREELEEKLKTLNNTAAVSPNGTVFSVQSMLKRAGQELEFGNTDKATEFYENALNADPENCEALWGLFLIDFKAKNESELIDRLDSTLSYQITNNKNFSLAVRFSQDKPPKGIIARINAFVLKMRSPQKWWSLFLNEMGATEEKYILNSITSAKLVRIRQSKNYALANKYADDEIGARIAAFEEGLASPEVAYQLFLEKFKVTDEVQLVGKITAPLLGEIEKDESYQNLLKKSEGPLRDRIHQFTTQIHSGERWWKMFLRDMSAQDEEDLLSSLAVDDIEKVRTNANFCNAKKFAEGELKEKIDEFERTILSADYWWNCCMERYGGFGDDSDAVLELMNRKILKDLERDLDYAYAKENATGTLRATIMEFDRRLHSSALWWQRMLDDLGFASEEELLGNFNMKLYDRVLRSEYYEKVKEYIDTDPEIRKKAEAFQKQLEAQKQAYVNSRENWQQLLKKYHCKTDNQLYTLQVSVVDDGYFIDSKRYAAESRDQELIREIENFEQKQPGVALQNKKACRAKEARRCIGLIFKFIALCIPMALEALFLAYCAGILCDLESLQSVTIPVGGEENYPLGAAFIALFESLDAFRFLSEGPYVTASLITFSVLMGLGAVQQIVGLIIRLCNGERTEPVSMMFVQFFAFVLFLVQQFIYSNFIVGSVTEWGLTGVVLFGPVVLYFKELVRPKAFSSPKKHSHDFVVYLPMLILSLAYVCAVCAVYMYAPYVFRSAANGMLMQLIFVLLAAVGLLVNCFKWRAKWKWSLLVTIAIVVTAVILIL